MKKAAVFMGSINDMPVVEKAINVMKDFGIDVTVRVLSAHRTPDAVAEFAKNARKENYGVIIAAAGMAAHLAGVLAAHTELPVIALPLKNKALEGLDALLAMVMMPPGVPVATVGIDCAQNAGYLAVQILGTGDDSLMDKFADFKKKQYEKCLEIDKEAGAKYNS
ncbi:MAG: 5-(carboxyamino)imidazole ribonucleotide mutase [Oscillospiraceae bacterium]|nr:5-(carboxyamino)imidazole ribonucleotide mutase [Oscillospiraceae bacterium]